jgi:hypothetical protein
MGNSLFKVKGQHRNIKYSVLSIMRENGRGGYAWIIEKPG